jgi:site-specific recombinase XerD
MVKKKPRDFPPPVTTPEAFAAFLLSREAQGVSPGTLRFYGDKLNPFIAFCERTGAPTIDCVTAALVRTFLVELQRAERTPWTLHGHARAIKTFLRFCAADELIERAPVFVMPKLPKQIMPAFTGAEVRKLLAACTTLRDRCIVLVLLDTGLRASELLALNVDDIEAATGLAHVWGGKGGKDRTVYLSARTRRELGRMWREADAAGPHTPLWVNARTELRLTDSGLRQLLERLGRRAGVEHCHPHTFRRTFALTCLREGMNIYVLARLMGHADITVLRQYLDLVQSDLEAAHRAASPVERLLR